MDIDFSPIELIHLPLENDILVDVLRLDMMHPLINGNKWFKLKYNLLAAQELGYSTIATFGGAYSNHIAATAAASQLIGLQSVGFIRGEKAPILSPTLLQAQRNAMHLEFLPRDVYRNNRSSMMTEMSSKYYFVDEGGAGYLGVKGAAEILDLVENVSSYQYIYSAVGTGTTLAGLINGSFAYQHVVGVSVMKNNFELESDIRKYLKDKNRVFELRQEYHFGGYAKKTPELVDFMNAIWKRWHLPTDFVYTAKSLFGLMCDLSIGRIPSGSKILFIHTGGLQGNLSLKDNVLDF